MIFLLTRVVRSHSVAPMTGTEGLVGEQGEAVRTLDPEGKVFVHGEYWEAVASDRLSPPAARVRVVRVAGDRLEVEEVQTGTLEG